MSDISEQVRRSSGSSPLGKLSRMLQSMSRRFPNTFLKVTPDDFGVLRDGGGYLRVVSSGHWTNEDMRDFLALFVIWLAVDPGRIRPPGMRLDGVLHGVKRELELSRGPVVSSGDEGG